MKTSNKILSTVLAIIGTLILAGLIYIKRNYPSKESTSKSGQEIKSDQKILDAFNKININGKFDIKLVSGKPGIHIDTDEETMKMLDIKVKDSTLSVGMKESMIEIRNNSSINIEIQFEALEEINTTGNSDIEMANAIESDHFEINQIGNGNCDFRIKSKFLHASLTGNGDISNEGSTDNIRLSVLGNGSIDMSKTESTDAELILIGNGDIKVNAKGAIKGNLTGNGDIHYKGTDKISIQEMGNGSVIKDN